MFVIFLQEFEKEVRQLCVFTLPVHIAIIRLEWVLDYHRVLQFEINMSALKETENKSKIGPSIKVHLSRKRTRARSVFLTFKGHNKPT